MQGARRLSDISNQLRSSAAGGGHMPKIERAGNGLFKAHWTTNSTPVPSFSNQ